MKIAIATTEKNEQSVIAERFGRSMYYAVYDTENEQFEFLDNPARDARGGAGVQASEFLVSKGIQSVIALEIGPKADRVLRNSQITLLQGKRVPIKDLIEKWKKNELIEI
jgi:predicted Fe-Mo cluster-binding NifX family protein